MTVLQRTYHRENFPVKGENIYIFFCIQNPAATDCLPCEIIPRCRRRRQTVNVFVIKIFVLFGPQRPTMPFLTYAYFHYNDIKQTEKHYCCLSPVLSGVLLSQAVKTPAPGSFHIPWALGQKARGHAGGREGRCMNGGGVWNKSARYLTVNTIDKCKAELE